MRSAKRTKKTVERRRAMRANRVVAIMHRPHKAPIKGSEPAWSLSTTKNMSVTGLLFLSETPYKIGDVIDVSVTMSGIIDIFQGYGEVVRIIPRTGKTYDIAVHLVDIKPPARSAKSHLKK